VVEREHFVTSDVPYLVGAMPDFFVDVPEALAAELGIENDGRGRVRPGGVTLSTDTEPESL